MRRGLAIFLILLFGLSPLVAALSASDESRLPPCCRRHGAHHCAMAMRLAAMRAEVASGKPFFTTPSTCPLFPGYAAALAVAIDALAAAQVSLPVLLALPHSPASRHAAARLSQIRTRAGRGPPANPLG